MSDSNFIGRGEILAKKILYRLVPCLAVMQQVNIKHIALPEDYELLDQEVKNHNFDLVIKRTEAPDIVVEINYKHGEKAARKWRTLFVPMIENAGLIAVAINDWECRPHGLFWLNSKKQHLAVTWDDYKDVMDALQTAGINPALYIEE